MTKFTKKVKSCFDLIKDNLDNIHTIGQIFSTSLIPKFYYTLCADVFQNAINCEAIFQYSSQHCHEINTFFTKAMKFLTAENILPPHVKEISERPTSQNGLHLLNPCKSVIIASCAPVLKSIQITKKGIPLHEDYIPLPSSIRSLYSNWTKG